MKKEPFEETEIVASATECTGLVPGLPVNDPEADEASAQLYAIHAPKNRNGVRWEGNEAKKKRR